ncbi:MAG: TerB family tellurite resistance protein [Microscillaceae bacterium]|nr:TerB family tellurite resistance protein [Microscillaceae bacterium]
MTDLAFNYNQAVFGLLLLGAKADGKLQDEEKKLLVALTSEDHHLTADEYKQVISLAKEKSEYDFKNLVYGTLNRFPHQDRIKALYWLLQLIGSDRSTDKAQPDLSKTDNAEEMEVYQRSLSVLEVNAEQVITYAQEREE